MTCPICNTPYEKVRTPQSVYLYRRRCGCKRPMVRVPSHDYTVRDVIQDEVKR